MAKQYIAKLAIVIFTILWPLSSQTPDIPIARQRAETFFLSYTHDQDIADEMLHYIFWSYIEDEFHISHFETDDYIVFLDYVWMKTVNNSPVYFGRNYYIYDKNLKNKNIRFIVFGIDKVHDMSLFKSSINVSLFSTSDFPDANVIVNGMRLPFSKSLQTDWKNEKLSVYDMPYDVSLEGVENIRVQIDDITIDIPQAQLIGTMSKYGPE